MNSPTLPPIETYFVFRELVTLTGEDRPRLMIPRSDETMYDYPFDLLFDSEEKAFTALKDWNIPPEESDEWILCQETLTPVCIVGAQKA